MKLSTRTRYGIRAVLELASHYGAEPLQIKVIARRQDISAKYLEQLMAILKSAGLVKSIRGAKGGYLLGRAPDQIRVIEVFNVLEGPIVTVECVENEKYCTRITDCIARGLWIQIQQAIEDVLGSISLQDLLERAKNSGALYYQI